MKQEALSIETILANNASQTEVIDQISQNSAEIRTQQWVAAGLAATLSIYGGYNATQAEAAAPPPPQPGTGQFIDAKTLPGRPDRVTKPTRDLLRSATVVLVKQEFLKNGSTRWKQVCTGLRRSAVDQNGATKDNIASTASHCFSEGLGVREGRFTPQVSASIAPAMNFIGQSSIKYGLSTPELVNDPVAFVTGISIELEDKIASKDNTIVEFTPIPPNKDQLNTPGFRSIDSVKAMPLQTDAEQAKTLPRPGAQVAMYGPTYINKTPYAGTGIYLGEVVRYPDPKKGAHTTYAVGVRTSNAKKDPCFYSKSGSSAISESGYVFGPLSMRLGLSDPKWKLKNHLLESTLDYRVELQEIKAMRTETQNTLGISLKEFPVVCLFNKTSQISNENTLAGLNRPSVW